MRETVSLKTIQESNPAVLQWLADNANRSEFAASLNLYLSRNACLTIGQYNAVVAGLQRAEAAKQAEASAPSADPSRLEAVFEVALKSGLKAPRLRVGEFSFSLAGASSVNAGAIYVKGEEGVYLGKLQRGRFIARQQGDYVARVLEIAADPEGEAIKHGKLTGRCAICSRKLSDAESVARGIGPICAEKFGW